METVAVVIVLGVLVALPVALISALVDVARRPANAFDDVGVSKPATVVLVLISGGVGGIYYWLVVRRRLS